MVFRKRAGMIWSVSMLLMGSGTSAAFEIREWLHSSVLTSVTTPVMRAGGGGQRAGQEGAPALALASFEIAIAGGDAVLAGPQAGRRSWRCTWSSPARAIRSRPRGKSPAAPRLSACRFTSCDPGTTITRTLGLTLRPFSTAAAARRSEMRELVQLPMNTTSMGMAQQRLAAFETHVAQRLGDGFALHAVGHCATDRAAARRSACPCRDWCRR